MAVDVSFIGFSSKIFQTECPCCSTSYKYPRCFANCSLKCGICRSLFSAAEKSCFILKTSYSNSEISEKVIPEIEEEEEEEEAGNSEAEKALHGRKRRIPFADSEEIPEPQTEIATSAAAEHRGNRILSAAANSAAVKVEERDAEVAEKGKKWVPKLIDVPDADFHDFDNQRTEKVFQRGQIWAVYDELGMPRYYARIVQILSLEKSRFKVRIIWLEESDSCKHFQSLGEFSASRRKVINELCIFSHVVDFCSQIGGVYKIYPRKDQIWAVYRKKDGMHSFVMAEVLNDFVEGTGSYVSFLSKVDGFRCVYQLLRPINVVACGYDHLRFSHHVPAIKLASSISPKLPKNSCWELDPAAISP